MLNNKKLKKILVVLYDKYDGDNGKIVLELAERKEKMDEASVQEYIIEHNLKLTDYITFWEKRFPNRYKDDLEAMLIIHKDNIKSLRNYMNYKLHSDNNFNGMKVKGVLTEFNISRNTSLNEFNKLLIDNNIQPIL